jgi:PTH1 family peptidyl-tRNA hydrolase
MKLIVGLGNPGTEYAKTRHNVGFMVLDALASDWRLEKKLRSELATTEIAGHKVLLGKPQTYMNLSGEAVQAIAWFYKIDPKDIVIIYDDVDLAFGKLRVRHGGGSGGHNGLKSLIQHLNDAFIRFRIGVGNESLKNPIPTEKFVLAPFTKDEQAQLPGLIGQTVSELTSYLQNPEEYSKHLISS